MPDSSFDSDSWLRRIGYEGPRAPTLQTLKAVISAQTSTIPYENIDVLLNRPPKLDLKSLQAKMVLGGRGGYCFEQNMLLRAGLSNMGFNTTSFVARVVRGITGNAPRPALYAGHMVLHVDLPEGPFLADVGFGNLTPTAPLLLSANVEQDTPHETMRFSSSADGLTLQAKLGEEWESLYCLLPHPRLDPDYEVANWYTATHPNSLFVRSLIAARPGPAGTRLTLFNGRFSLRKPHNRMERRMLNDEADFNAMLTETFGLALSSMDVSAALETLDRKGGEGCDQSDFHVTTGREIFRPQFV